MGSEEVKINIQGDEKKEPKPCCCFSSRKRCLMYCCAPCCCIWVTLGIIVGVFAAMFQTPEVKLQSAMLHDVQVTGTQATLVIDVFVNVKNNNAWPFKATVEQVEVDTWSLDKAAADTVGVAHYLGKGTFPNPVEIGTDSDVTFSVRASVAVDPSTANLLQRMNRDCGALATPNSQGTKDTKLKILITKTVASVAGILFDLRGIDIEIETLVSCEQSSRSL